MALSSALASSLHNLPSSEYVLIEKAYLFAKKVHEGQLRRQGTPYLDHPVAVALNLINIFSDYRPTLLAAALLHDTLEDTATTKTDLLKLFSKETVDLVVLMTNPYSRLSKEERLSHYRELLSNQDALLLKVSDRLSNLADLKTINDVNFIRYYLDRTRFEMLFPNSPLLTNEKAHAALLAAIVTGEAHLLTLKQAALQKRNHKPTQ